MTASCAGVEQHRHLGATVTGVLPSAPPSAVTFDFWNTLVVADAARARLARRQAVAAVLAEHGVAIDDDLLDRGLVDAARRFEEAWQANRQFVGEDGAAALVGRLGLTGAGDLIPELVAAFLRAAEGLHHDLAPGVRDVLVALHEAGVRLGIVCDVGLTPSDVLRSYLAAQDVLGWFDHWSFSDEVGRYKPDPVIFRHALDGLGVDDPSRVVHVGDLIRTDVIGARGLGMGAIRYAGIHDDAPGSADGGPEPAGGLVDADVVVHDHRDLLVVLGVA